MKKQSTLFHIDMNAFFASCEQTKDPSLKNKPIIVAGDPERRSGIVLAASYAAKAYGIYTTMPIYRAKKLCPHLVVVKSTYSLYMKMSQQVMAIFDSYTPVKQQVSIDEAYLDMTETDHLFGPPQEAALAIQTRIKKELDLGCSVGIAPNKFLAKMASDMKKPMGITTLMAGELEDKLWPLAIEKMYGVGKKTAQLLNTMGIHQIGDLAKVDPSQLSQLVGEKSAQSIHAHANGLGEVDLTSQVDLKGKSMGNELTYSKDIQDLETCRRELLLLADTVAYRCRRKKIQGYTITVKVKTKDFKVMTRSKSLKEPTYNTDTIFSTAWQLFIKNQPDQAIRLLGVSVSHFEPEDSKRQLSLFDQGREEKGKVDALVDELRGRYGYQAIKRGSILDRRHKKGEALD